MSRRGGEPEEVCKNAEVIIEGLRTIDGEKECCIQLHQGMSVIDEVNRYVGEADSCDAITINLMSITNYLQIASLLSAIFTRAQPFCCHKLILNRTNIDSHSGDLIQIQMALVHAIFANNVSFLVINDECLMDLANPEDNFFQRLKLIYQHASVMRHQASPASIHIKVNDFNDSLVSQIINLPDVYRLRIVARRSSMTASGYSQMSAFLLDHIKLITDINDGLSILQDNQVYSQYYCYFMLSFYQQKYSIEKLTKLFSPSSGHKVLMTFHSIVQRILVAVDNTKKSAKHGHCFSQAVRLCQSLLAMHANYAEQGVIFDIDQLTYFIQKHSPSSRYKFFMPAALLDHVGGHSPGTHRYHPY